MKNLSYIFAVTVLCLPTIASADTLLKRTLTQYEDVSNGASTFVAPVSVLEQSFGATTQRDRATEYAYDSVGNVTEVIELGEVTSNTDGTYTDVLNDQRSREYTYAVDQEGNTTSYVSSEVLKNKNGVIAAKSEFIYDGLSLGSVGAGNLTTDRVFINKTGVRENTFTYDQYGNVLTATDAKGKVTTYEYDEYDLYPTSITNPLGHMTTYTYDYRTGSILEERNDNGLVQLNSYDVFGRLLTVEKPDPETDQAALFVSYLYDDTPLHNSVTKIAHRTDTDESTSVTYLDGFGRTVQERVEADSAYAVTDTRYAANGLVEAKSAPYFDGGITRSAPSGDSSLYTTYEYDALDRVVGVDTVIGTTHTDHDGWDQSVTDVNGTLKTFAYDAYERLSKVSEAVNDKPVITRYFYNVRDNLTKIIDAAGNRRVVGYNWQNERTKLEDLHKNADTEFSVWKYAYDKNGNQTRATLPDGSVIKYQYDALNRIKKETYADTSSVTTYTYDSCENGVGKLCVANTGEVKTTYGYNLLGQEVQKEVEVLGQIFATTRTFDRVDNVLTETLPDGRIVTYDYDRGGKLTEVSHDSVGQLVTAIEYGPHGKPEVTELANGTVEENIYDARELYRLTARTFSVALPTTNADIVAPVVLLATTTASSTDGASPTDADDPGLVAVFAAPTLATAKTTPFARLTSSAYGLLSMLSPVRIAYATTTAESDDGRASDVAPEEEVVFDIVIPGEEIVLEENLLDDGRDDTVPTEPVEEVVSTEVVETATSTEEVLDDGREEDTTVSTSTPDIVFVPADEPEASTTPETASTTEPVATTTEAVVKPEETVKVFAEAAAVATSTSPRTLLSFMYSYDPIGNITGISEEEIDQTPRTYTYTYDDLYRLTRAEESGGYTRTYFYNKVGNITKKSGAGKYLYEGHEAGSLANPHAATVIGGTPVTYDERGNMLTFGADTSYEWDYNNRMVQSDVDGVVSTYLYDHTGQRVAKTVEGETTYYPSANYEVTPEGTEANIYGGDTLLATVREEGGVYETEYVHTDHLGSTRLVTDASGNLAQRLTYFPFGGERKDERVDDAVNQTNRYTGHDYDEATDLSYMGARYYDGKVGRFTAQDPVSLSIGDWGTVQQKTDGQMSVFLKNPQTQNSYSYTINNPLKFEDKNGEWIDVAIDAGFTLYSAYKLGEAILTGGDVKGEAANLALDAGGVFVPGVVGLGTARRVAKYSDEAAAAASKYKNNRPAFKQGQVDQVWEKAKGSDGLVRDPNTGDLINWAPGQSRKGVWDMGHKPGQEYSSQIQKLENGQISEKQFLDHYKDADNYQPELPSNNRSRKYEEK